MVRDWSYNPIAFPPSRPLFLTRLSAQAPASLYLTRPCIRNFLRPYRSQGSQTQEVRVHGRTRQSRVRNEDREQCTTAGTQEVEQRMEHDYTDVGVRVVPGATTELPRKPEPRVTQETLSF